MAGPASFTELRNYEFLTLVDRAAVGGQGAEIIYDGVRLTWAPGQVEKVVPHFVADWLFTKSKEYVWTKGDEREDTPGVFTNRYAIKDATPEQIAQWGEECADTSAIELDDTVLEGTDVGLYRTGPVRAERINIPSHELRDRLGRGGHILPGR